MYTENIDWSLVYQDPHVSAKAWHQILSHWKDIIRPIHESWYIKLACKSRHTWAAKPWGVFRLTSRPSMGIWFILKDEWLLKTCFLGFSSRGVLGSMYCGVGESMFEKGHFTDGRAEAPKSKYIRQLYSIIKFTNHKSCNTRSFVKG